MQKISNFSISLSHKNKNKKIGYIYIIRKKINTAKLSTWKDAQTQLHEKGGG